MVLMLIETIHYNLYIYTFYGCCECFQNGYELDILRGTRNLSFVLRRSLLRTFETISILVITFEWSNNTASKSIRRERKMRPMELSGSIFRRMGQNQSVHVLIKSYVSVCNELQSHNFV